MQPHLVQLVKDWMWLIEIRTQCETLMAAPGLSSRTSAANRGQKHGGTFLLQLIADFTLAQGCRGVCRAICNGTFITDHILKFEPGGRSWRVFTIEFGI